MEEILTVKATILFENVQRKKCLQIMLRTKQCTVDPLVWSSGQKCFEWEYRNEIFMKIFLNYFQYMTKFLARSDNYII